MKFSFEAKICKAGINPYVDVPLSITGKMIASRGYIPIKGKIEKQPFQQTLVPVKNEAYRLYVNGPMLKGSNAKVEDVVKFTIEQDIEPRTVPIPAAFKKKLIANGLMPEFKRLTAYRQKEILKYLNFLKTTDALIRNIDKVTNQLKKKQHERDR